MLVGSVDLAEKYVEQSGDVYMARGHFAPKADFMYTSWQVMIYGSHYPLECIRIAEQDEGEVESRH